jgi:signal-transduction protein with cAMP-binding, CBS, and nucleotidyltransferase domain
LEAVQQGASQVSGSDYEQLLAALPFLAKAKLPAEVLAELAKTARVRTYRAADEIVVQRRYGTSMFVLVSGKVHMTSMTPARDRFVPVATLAQPGEIFGEDALLGRGERMTTASAVTDVVALEIEKHRFDLLARRYPTRSNRSITAGRSRPRCARTRTSRASRSRRSRRSRWRQTCGCSRGANCSRATAICRARSC